MSTDARDQRVSTAIQASTQGIQQQDHSTDKGCHAKNEPDIQSDVLQEEDSHDQIKVPLLPTELLTIILSYTGTQAAVLAAGPAGMKTWSESNIAQWLTQRYHNVNGQPNFIQAMITAITYRLDEAATQLFSQTTIEEFDSDAWTNVMKAAAQHGCECIVSKILDWMSSNTSDDLIHISCKLMMMSACQAGQLQIVKALLDEAQPYACRPDEEDSKYLLTAAQYGHVDVVKELLNPAREHCARANAEQSSCLSAAAKSGFVDVVMELLDPSREHHAKANDNNCSALLEAASHGHLNCVRVLLDTTRPNCATANVDDNIALITSVLRGHHLVVKELLDSSRPNHAVANARGSLSLFVASHLGYADLLRELLWQEQHPADPCSERGVRALEEAVSQGNLECCRLLKGYPGLPPRKLPDYLLKAARKSKNVEVVALVKEANKRYRSVAGPPSMWVKHNYVFAVYGFFQAWIVTKLSWMYYVTWPLNRIMIAVILWDIFMFAFFWFSGSTRRNAAEQNAALENAEYRAAWYKSQEQ